MLTPKEVLDYHRLHDRLPGKNEVWVHALELVEHCLERDTDQTLFRCRDDHHDRGLHREWVEAMQNRNQLDEKYAEIWENAFDRKEQWTECFNDTGSFDVSSWLSGEQNCFVDTEKQFDQGPAISILIDINVNYHQRHDSYMVDRQREVYRIVAQCESTNRPCRVIGVFTCEIDEIRGDLLKIFMVVKDYDDPIFPAIWGTLIDNQCTNSFLNTIQNYFTGTHSMGNGSCETLRNPEQFFPEEDLILFGTDWDETKNVEVI